MFGHRIAFGSRLPHSPLRPTRRQYIFLATLVLPACLVLLHACAHLPPLPADFDPNAYHLITFQALRHPEAAALQPGKKIKVPAYFWQFLTYDPAILCNYPNYLRHPLSWPSLEWAALYGSPDLRDYYDLLIMTPAQKERYSPKRLDHIMVFGELAPLSPGRLYLRLHHLEKMPED